MNIVESLQSIQSSLPHLASEWTLVFTFLLAFVIDVFFKSKKAVSSISFVGICLSTFLVINQTVYHPIDTKLFSGFYSISKPILQFKILISFASIIALFPYFIGVIKVKSKEFFYLFPLFLLSANLLCMSNHLLSIFIGVEFLSILSYLYIAFEINSKNTAESSSKYILFGAFASAIMLYGITWLYGLTGTLHLDNVFLSTLSKAPVSLVAMSLIMFVGGILFKISAAPFHYYSPDVYEGSAPSTIAFISTIPKIAGLSILYSFVSHFHYNWEGTVLIWPNFSWEKTIAILSIATMFIGNLSALSQKNLKRMMAYSSISHTGFLLISLVVFSDTGLNALFYYSLVYIISNFAVFFILHYWESVFGVVSLTQLVGLGKIKPWSSAMMIVVLASLTGLPPLAGFVAKFFVFGAVFQQYQSSMSPWLLYVLIAGVLNTVIALFYYFNIARHLFLMSGTSTTVKVETPESMKVLLGIITVLVAGLVLLGIFPISF